MNASDANQPPGQIPAPANPPRWRQQKHRGLLWLCFWILFLTTPAAPFAGQFLLRFGAMGALRFSPMLVTSGGLLAGIGAAAFILARLYSNTTTQLIWRTVAFAFLIAIVYGVIGFAGCLLIMKALKNV